MSAKKKSVTKKIARKQAVSVAPAKADPAVERPLMTQHQDRRKERMLDSLEKHMGVVLYAIREVGIARKTHYNWMRDDPDYAEKVEAINEGTGDFVERKLLEAVQEKQPAVMIFYAKTKLRHRGYVERHELTGANGEEIKVGGHLSVSAAMQELPPASIQNIVEKVVGGAGRAEEALRKLKEDHGNRK